jgi:hypothetical protein
MIDYDPELGTPELEPPEIKLLATLWSVPDEPQLKGSGSSAATTKEGRLAQLEALDALRVIRVKQEDLALKTANTLESLTGTGWLIRGILDPGIHSLPETLESHPRLFTVPDLLAVTENPESRLSRFQCLVDRISCRLRAEECSSGHHDIIVGNLWSHRAEIQGLLNLLHISLGDLEGPVEVEGFMDLESPVSGVSSEHVDKPMPAMPAVPRWGEDIVHQAMVLACDRFGGFGDQDRIFNAAGFCQAFWQLAGMVGVAGLDGKVVRAILSGRPDCEILSGGAHFKIVVPSKALRGSLGSMPDHGDEGLGVCPDCQEPQFRCPSGVVCKNGHGY